MSDLDPDKAREEGEEGVEPSADGKADFGSRIQALQDEVDALTARLEEEKLHPGIPLTRSRLRRHEIASTPVQMRGHDRSASLMSSRLQGQASGREELVRRLEEMEKESRVVSKHVDQLNNSVKKLVKSSTGVLCLLHVHVHVHTV